MAKIERPAVVPFLNVGPLVDALEERGAPSAAVLRARKRSAPGKGAACGVRYRDCTDPRRWIEGQGSGDQFPGVREDDGCGDGQEITNPEFLGVIFRDGLVHSSGEGAGNSDRLAGFAAVLWENF